jgi:hypothetical protein
MSRTDGKRPDGVTLVPWQAGRTAVWDVTVIDTLATSYLPSTSITPGSAAEIAAARKVDKYVNLSATHTFVPIALETLGPISVQSLSFCVKLAAASLVQLTTHVSQPSYSRGFLWQSSVLTLCALPVPLAPSWTLNRLIL